MYSLRRFFFKGFRAEKYFWGRYLNLIKKDLDQILFRSPPKKKDQGHRSKDLDLDHDLGSRSRSLNWSAYFPYYQTSNSSNYNFPIAFDSKLMYRVYISSALNNRALKFVKKSTQKTLKNHFIKTFNLNIFYHHL